MSDFASPELSSQQFIGQVLALSPKVAIFDCDGTLWADDSGQEFFYYELDRGLIPKPVADWARARYTDYLNGNIDERTMCGEMLTIHAGIAEEKVIALAAEFFRAQIEPRIFSEMLELAHRLAGTGCELWAVSSTNVWVVREGARRFAIPAERVLGASIEVERGYCTRRLRAVPTGEGKAEAIREQVASAPDVVFGNSVHDLAMLEMAKHAHAINPTAELEQAARDRGWPIYRPVLG
jgi:phosphoserine phosphatase